MLNLAKPNILFYKLGSTSPSTVEYHLLLAPVPSVSKGIWVLLGATLMLLEVLLLEILLTS